MIQSLHFKTIFFSNIILRLLRFRLNSSLFLEDQSLNNLSNIKFENFLILSIQQCHDLSLRRGNHDQLSLFRSCPINMLIIVLHRVSISDYFLRKRRKKSMWYTTNFRYSHTSDRCEFFRFNQKQDINRDGSMLSISDLELPKFDRKIINFNHLFSRTAQQWTG